MMSMADAVGSNRNSGSPTAFFALTGICRMDTRRTNYDGVLTKDADPIAIKEVSEEGVVASYDSLWWVVDSYGEFTIPTSADRTIAERGPKSGNNRILLRYEHEWTIGSYLSMVTDETGLYSEAKISDDGQWGTAARRQLADGVPYGKSIGFRAIKRRPATEADLANLKLDTAPAWVLSAIQSDRYDWLTALEEFKLLESSIVSFPAVEPIVIDSYRADQTARLLTRVLTDLKKGRVTDDHLSLLSQIASILPADVAPEKGRDAASTTRAADSTEPTAIRNYRAELLLAQLGV